MAVMPVLPSQAADSQRGWQRAGSKHIWGAWGSEKSKAPCACASARVVEQSKE